MFSCFNLRLTYVSQNSVVIRWQGNKVETELNDDVPY